MCTECTKLKDENEKLRTCVRLCAYDIDDCLNEKYPCMSAVVEKTLRIARRRLIYIAEELGINLVNVHD